MSEFEKSPVPAEETAPLHAADWDMRNRVRRAVSVGLEALRDPETRKSLFVRPEIPAAN